MLALIFREKTGCNQYPFETIEEVIKFVSRKPYSLENLKVMPIDIDDSVLEMRTLPAKDVPAFIIESLPHLFPKGGV